MASWKENYLSKGGSNPPNAKIHLIRNFLVNKVVYGRESWKGAGEAYDCRLLNTVNEWCWETKLKDCILTLFAITIHRDAWVVYYWDDGKGTKPVGIKVWRVLGDEEDGGTFDLSASKLGSRKLKKHRLGDLIGWTAPY
ncbi:hypothetical protein CK203_074030 [Vitis vinifera]|uniref:Uncharacterized protein n=1 Tax=Vitis vinifera TaxID=29760 RepID=A0A438E7P6_VITVI|nr:hypothetical protein CK203_074030 [Vitis vinifera]